MELQFNIHVLFQLIQMITLLGELLLEGVEPVKWELLANTVDWGCRLMLRHGWYGGRTFPAPFRGCRRSPGLVRGG